MAERDYIKHTSMHRSAAWPSSSSMCSFTLLSEVQKLYPQLHGQGINLKGCFPEFLEMAVATVWPIMTYKPVDVSRGEAERNNKGEAQKHKAFNAKYRFMEKCSWTAVINWPKFIASGFHISKIPTSVNRPKTVMVDDKNFAVWQTLN